MNIRTNSATEEQHHHKDYIKLVQIRWRCCSKKIAIEVLLGNDKVIQKQPTFCS